jgi:quercetin dioxygenase-like cupin family protein
MDDEELNQLLHEWKAPDAPPYLRPRPGPRRWVGWLATGSIRVPVPAAFAALALAVLWPVVLRPEAPASPAVPAPPVAQRSGELARYSLSGPLEGFDAVLTELNFGPGVSAPQHRHPGFVLGYVLEGQMRNAINHEPDQVVPAGGTFFEPDGALHTAFGSASSQDRARILAFLVVPNGSRLTVPR